MGFKLTWMATEDTNEAALLERMGLQIVGETEGYFGADFTLSRLPNGWLIIVSNEQENFDDLAPEVLPEGFVLTGWMNETVMVSECRGFREGALEWAVIHNPDVDIDSVQIEGTPPAEFAGIYKSLQAEQAKATQPVDYIFDAPIRLSAEICGFVHDEDMDTTWKALTIKGAPPKPTGKGFFARLFGR